MSSVRGQLLQQNANTSLQTSALLNAIPKGSIGLIVILVANGVPANHTPAGSWTQIAQQTFDTLATPTDTLYVFAKLGQGSIGLDQFQMGFAGSYVWAQIQYTFSGCRAADKDGASLAEHVASLVGATDTAAQTLAQSVVIGGPSPSAGFGPGSGMKSFLLAAGLNGATATTGIGSVSGYHGATAQENTAAGRTIIGSADQGYPASFSGNLFDQVVFAWTATNRRSANAVVGLQDAPSLSLAGMGC